MGINKNIIGRQIVQFQYDGKVDGHALQKEVSDWCSLILIPEIEQELDTLSFNDEYITIDKLEIDTTVDSNNWQQKIKSEIVTTLKQKLKDHILLAEKQTDKQDATAFKMDELILFYFEKGRLPWWADTLIKNDFKETLDRWINEEKSQFRINEIKKKLQSIISASVVERIVNQTHDAAFFSLLRNIFKNETELINNTEFFISDVWITKPAAQLKKEVVNPVYEYLLGSLLKSKNVLEPDSLMKSFLYQVKKQNAESLINTSLSLQRPSINKIWKKVLQEDKSELEKHTADSYRKLITDMTNEEKDNTPKGIQQNGTADGIFIENAGAVIIAPFLTALFTKTGISQNGEIMDAAVAIASIQYAVTGETIVEEYELVLPKILCGLDIDLPINTAIELSTIQKGEIVEMLKSIIEHWTILGNTSIDGLRNSFLMRTGKLTLNDDGLLLQVEQKPFDMLLQQLPWNVSMIKLPWMEKLLRTEWIS